MGGGRAGAAAARGPVGGWGGFRVVGSSVRGGCSWREGQCVGYRRTTRKLGASVNRRRPTKAVVCAMVLMAAMGSGM